jgi:hypothetical protein
MTSESFEPAPGFGQMAGLGPVHAIPLSQADWQPAHVPINGLGSGMLMHQSANLEAFGNNAPSILENWDWQGLGLGHPMSWGESYTDVNDPGRTRDHHAGIFGVFTGPGMSNNGRESLDADDRNR